MIPAAACGGRVPRALLLAALLASVLVAAALPAHARAPKLQPAEAREPAAKRALAAERALDKVEMLKKGLGVRTGRELTLALRDLALRLPALEGDERREAREILARPTDGPADPADDGYLLPEHSPPHCTAHFCIHWVDLGPDAPSLADSNGKSDLDGVPDYIERTAQIFERSYRVENVELGWRRPKGDGARGGGNNKTDVYVKDLSDSGSFGYSAIDIDQDIDADRSVFGYIVIDDDYSPAEYPHRNPLDSLRATAAHEYNHMHHFTYDFIQDQWMLESTATWMEDKVFDGVNDYLNYVRAWVTLTEVPITFFDGFDPDSFKAYGSAVWNRWLDEQFGQDVIREGWERSVGTRPDSFAPAAYTAGLATDGKQGFEEQFVRFSAAVAEWRAEGFSEGRSFPHVERRGTLRPNADRTIIKMDHTTFALFGIPRRTEGPIRLVVEFEPRTDAAIALVTREGDSVNGRVVTRIRRLPEGRTGSIVLEDPRDFSRITAVLVNTDISVNGYSDSEGDWRWTKDRRRATARVVTE